MNERKKFQFKQRLNQAKHTHYSQRKWIYSQNKQSFELKFEFHIETLFTLKHCGVIEF